MKVGFRVEKIKHAIFTELNLMLLKEIKDPRLSQVRATRVELSKDLSNAVIYFSKILNDETEKDEILETLNKAKGYFKREISSRIKLRSFPDIKFKFDEGMAYSQYISSKIKGLNIEDNED